MTAPPPRRRAVLQGGALALLLLGGQHIARGASIVAVRLWPAQDYTRVTIESDTALKTTYRLLASPPRLAVDIEGQDLDPALRELVAKVRADDPNIAGIRVGQNAPGIVRLVVDLKRDIKPQVFTLTPVAAYQYRLVFDLYPATPADPLDELIAERMKELGAASSASNAQPESTDVLGELIARQMEREKERAGNAAPPGQPDTLAHAGPQRPPAPGAAARTQRLIIVAIDPGHGGEDPGATGPGGTHEKDVVLRIAHKLRERVNNATAAGNPMRAYLTRDQDFFVPLQTRVEKARRVGADLFVSIHADAFLRSDAAGASVFALSERGASSTAARWLAQNENDSDRIGGVNTAARNQRVQSVLLDMSTTAQIRDSLRLGDAVLRQMGQVGRLHKGSVERANFAVLRSPDVPSVLVETAFISNPDEERRLRQDSYQNALADALLIGLQKYFAANPPLARNRQT